MSGDGKSMILGQACTEFARTGKRVVIASMEMKPVITLARMCRQQYGRIPTVDEIQKFHQWSDGVIWIYDQQGAVKSDRILAVLRYCADVLKADHFVIDSLMKCGMAEDDYIEIYWSVPNAAVTIQHLAASGTPTKPSTQSVVATLSFVSALPVT